MPAPAQPADPAGGPPTCTPETLYTYVVGRPPGPELGYPAERGDMHGDASGSFLQDEHAGMADQADVDRDSGASARAKKRRKVQRRSKVSEIWFPRAEMAFCTCVTAIPPNGRTKIKFFGRPLGRNELIAAICTLATHRLYNRKQISSHSQVLKDKVPLQFKEIFTFEDKSRGTDEPAESSTANVIETYQFPDIIYSIIDYPLGTDLANAPKPGWLVELEAGGTDSQAPPMDPSTPRGYNPTYWSNSPQQSSGYPSYYDRPGGGGGGGYPKGKDRDGRPIGGDPYYQYSPPGALRQSNAPYPPPSHSLPPLGLPRDIDTGGPGDNGRYGYSQGTSRARMSNGGWDDHARSPTSTSSYDAPQSQGSAGMSPRQTTGQWQDVKPNISNAELTLPPLQEVPSPSSYDWKDRPSLYPDAKWGGAPQSATSAQSAVRSGLPGLSPLPSFGLVASQSYPSSGGAGGWSEPSPYWDSTSSLRTDRNNSISRIPPFQPSSLDFTADARTSSLSLTASEALVNGPPMALDTVLVTRYPFLGQIPQSSGVVVYHLDVPLTIPPTDPARDLLLDSISDIGIELGLQSPGGDSAGWAVTTDSLWLSTAGPNRQPRVMTPLRASGASGELSCKIQLPRLGHLYNMLLQNMRVNFYYNASLGDIGLPNTDIVQRIVREATEPRAAVDPSLMPDMGSDWASAAAVLIWTLRVTDGSQPSVITARQIDFDARYEPLSDQHIASHILGSEEQKPSTFNWM